jgi:hypothetical protein
MPQIMQYPGGGTPFKLRFSELRLTLRSRNGNRHKATVGFRDVEASSGQTGAVQLSPKSEVCDTRA